MQYHKRQKRNKSDPGEIPCKEESNVYVTGKSSTLKEAESLERLDIAESVTRKGTRSHSLNRQRNSYKGVFKSDFGSEMNRRKDFITRRYSRWDDSRRLKLCQSSESITSRSPRKTDNNVTEHHNITGNNNWSNGAESSKADFKTLLTMFLKRSSIYALNQVGNSATTRRKIFWALIMVIGLLGSGFQIIQYLKAYFKYPVVVNMDSNYTLDQEFPSVTICNLNRVRKEFLPCLKQKLGYHECNVSTVEDIDLNFTMTNDGNCDLLSRDISPETLRNYAWQNLYLSQDGESQKLYGHHGENFMRSCSFNGEICTLENFRKIISPDYGNCLTFNAANESTDSLKTPFVGPNGGLELELDLEVDEYVPYTTAVGARVQIHDPYHAPDYTKGINVSPGFETSITLSKYMMLRLEKPYKDRCKKYPVGEDMNLCNAACFFGMIQDVCNCTLFGNDDGKAHCDLTIMSVMCCIYTINLGSCTCPLSCEDTYYQFNIFSAIWPSHSYYKDNQINSTVDNEYLSIEKVRETRLRIKIYYDTLETVMYQQRPMYQSSEVFSQIGGQMGLWLGLSLVAIFECIENFVSLWHYRAKKRFQIGSNHQIASTKRIATDEFY